MGKRKVSIGYYIIGSALIWGAVIYGCSQQLKGTECFDQINLILSTGAGLHLILIWGPLAVLLRKVKK